MDKEQSNNREKGESKGKKEIKRIRLSEGWEEDDRKVCKGQKVV